MTADGFRNQGGKLGHGVGRCPCGKIQYVSRKNAKKVARFANLQGLTAYQCGDFWHLGHLPKVVSRGRVSRDKVARSTA